MDKYCRCEKKAYTLSIFFLKLCNIAPHIIPDKFDKNGRVLVNRVKRLNRITREIIQCTSYLYVYKYYSTSIHAYSTVQAATRTSTVQGYSTVLATI